MLCYACELIMSYHAQRSVQGPTTHCFGCGWVCHSVSQLVQALSDNSSPLFQNTYSASTQDCKCTSEERGYMSKDNIMMVHEHNNFPSDVFTTLAGLGATVTIGEWLYSEVIGTLVKFSRVNDV